MRKFRKLVAIEPIKMIPEAIDSLGRYADEVIIHSDMCHKPLMRQQHA